MTLVVRPATAADVRHFYPDASVSFRATVAELDGELKAIVGVALVRPCPCLFSRFDEDFRPHLKRWPVLKAIKHTHDLIAACRVPVRAIEEPTEPQSPALLERLGFSFAAEVGGDRIYEWTPYG